MFLQVLGGVFIASAFVAILSWFVCLACDVSRSKSDIETLEDRVTNLEAVLMNQLKCKKKKLEVEKKIAVCKLRKK